MNSDSVKTLVIHPRVISEQGGGSEKTILNSPRFLQRQGFHGVCLYLGDPDDEGFSIIRERAGLKEAPLVEVDDFRIFDWRIVRRIREAVESIAEQSGCVGAEETFFWHGHDYKSNLLGLLL